METLETLIANHPFAKGMKPEHLRLLAGAAMDVVLEEGETVFREGDVANRFYLLLEGEVVIESHAKDSPAVFIQAVSGGDVLGWSWLFPPYYWNFDARAVRRTRAIFFYGTRLRDKSEEDRDFGYELMKRMAQVVLQRLQATRRRLLAASPKT